MDKPLKGCYFPHWFLNPFRKVSLLPHTPSRFDSLFPVLALITGAIVQGLIAQSTDQPSLILWLVYFTAALFFARYALSPVPAPAVPLASKTERVLFIAIMGLAAFLRIYRLDSIPSGLFADQGFEGWTALRILHEGFRPTWEADVFQNPALLLYQLAGWFFLVPAGRLTFYLFFVLISLVTLPLVYAAFRQLAGTRAALCALFFLAVMRWNINFSRNGFPTIQVPFYIFGTLAFLLLGLRTGKRWAFYLSAVFFGLGFYTYQSYKAFPLWLLLLAICVLFQNRGVLQPNGKPLGMFLGIALVLILPFLLHNLNQQGLGSREDSISILTRVVEAGNLSPLLENIHKTALMFQWQGDPLSRHNLSLHRMLDDGTGILFLFGFVMALLTPSNKVSFFALTGFFVMSLPGVLSINSAHANRLLGLTPLIALMAALPLSALWERLEGSGHKFFTLTLAGLALAFITWQNADLYFHAQPADPDAFEQYDSEETFVGQKTGQYGGAYDLYFSPYYSPIYSLKFLSYFHRVHIHLFKVPEDLAPPAKPNGMGKGFFLESDRNGLYALLKRLYPGGRVEDFLNPKGNLSMRLYLVPPEELAKKKGLSPDQMVPRGLRGYYYDDPKNLKTPALVHNDPLLNFSNEGSFPLKAPVILWKGILEAPRSGTYHFFISTWCDASLLLDGKEQISTGEDHADCFLQEGAHPIEVIFQNPGGENSWCLDLYWQKPGANKDEIIPNEAFGIIRRTIGM